MGRARVLEDLHQTHDFAQAAEIPQPQTWQVPRAEFDQLLLEHSRRSGVDVRQRHRVLDVAFDSKGVDLAFEGPDGNGDAYALDVVDASAGRWGLMARQFGERRMDPLLRTSPCTAQFEGVPAKRAGAPETSGW